MRAWLPGFRSHLWGRVSRETLLEYDALIKQLLRSREVWKNELQKLDKVKCSLPHLVVGMQALLA